MTNVAGKFNEHGGIDPYEWKAAYSGRAGYERMYREITTSFYDAFPELKGKVGVFNFAAPDRDQELARLRRELNTDAQFIPGIAEGSATANASRTAAVVWGMDPAGQHWGGFEKLGPADIDSLAWHMTHELFHGADFMLNPSHKEPEENNRLDKWFESFADAGRVSLHLRNKTDDPKIMFDSMVIGQDSDGPSISVGANGKYLTSADWQKWNPSFMSALQPNKYDNGELLRQIHAETPQVPSTRSYSFQGWRDTFDQVTAARDNWPALKFETYNFYSISSAGLAMGRARYSEQAVQALEPHKEALRKEWNMSPEGAVDNLFLRHDLPQLAKDPKFTPEIRDALRTIESHRNQYLDWVEDRIDIYPNAARMLSAVRYDGTSAPAMSTPPVSSSVVSMARSVDLYLKGGDPLDKRAAEFFSQAYDGPLMQEGIDILPELYTNQKRREELAAIGRPPEPATITPVITPPAQAPAILR